MSSGTMKVERLSVQLYDGERIAHYHQTSTDRIFFLFERRAANMESCLKRQSDSVLPAIPVTEQTVSNII